MHHAKSLALGLNSASCQFGDDDLVLSVLNGLEPDFDSIVASVTSRIVPISYDELIGLLLSHEQRLKRNQQLLDISANYVSKKTKNNAGTRGRGKFRGGRSGRGGQFEGGRNNSSNKNQGKPSVAGMQCQICGRLNHSALTCYQRYNHATLAANMAEASYASINNQNWLADSGATHHITNSLNNLDKSHEYAGSDEVKVGNGTGISISNIGSSKFSSPHSSFTLKDILHDPDITMNLLSVHKFTLHNGVSIEFFPFHVHIKEQ